MKPAPDIATVEASFGLVTEAKGSSDRDAAILGSLGFAHLEGDRASPEGMPFESGALPTGPPEPDAEVLRSFGYEDWQYGRGSPIASSLGLKTGAKGPGNPTFLRPLGYVEWQDGHALAVISDGKGGVCLVAKGETLEGGFRVVNIGPEAVEIVELSPDQTSAAPALRLSSSGDVHLDSVEAHPGATPIPKLPLARASSALGLELVRIAQPAKATGTRPGKKAVGRRAQRIALPTPPVAETSPLPPPPEGKVRPQCKNPQPTPINLAPPKARAHRPSGKPHQLDSHAAPPISLRLTSGSAQPLGPPAGFRDSLFSSF